MKIPCVKGSYSPVRSQVLRQSRRSACKMTHWLKALNRRGSLPVSNGLGEGEWLVLHSRPTPCPYATADAFTVFSVSSR